MTLRKTYCHFSHPNCRFKWKRQRYIPCKECMKTCSQILAAVKCLHILLDNIFSVPLLLRIKLGWPPMIHHMQCLLLSWLQTGITMLPLWPNMLICNAVGSQSSTPSQYTKIYMNKVHHHHRPVPLVITADHWCDIISNGIAEKSCLIEVPNNI
jgi:hypothetical protein